MKQSYSNFTISTYSKILLLRPLENKTAPLLTHVLLNLEIPAFANSVDPDQLASEEANWSGSALFDIKYMNLY